MSPHRFVATTLAGAILTFRLLLGATSLQSAPGGHALSAARGAEAARPNIVLILTDDQDLLLGSLERMPKTRALLTQRGLTFSNYFVTQALCCPSRASILTGQHVHNHGVISTNPPLGGFVKFHGAGLESETIALALQRVGYATALLGKYFNAYPRTEEPKFVPPGWSEWQVPSPTRAAYRQFDYTLNVNGTLVAHGSTPADYLTDVLSAAAEGFVTREAAAGRPFFLYLAPTAPHDPITAAARHRQAFPGLTAPRGPSFNEADMHDKPSFLRGPRLSRAAIAELDRRYRARAQALLAVDDMVERLFAALERGGVLDSTYVFFTSDNGIHLGQHRLQEGKNTAYEEDIHVPLIVRGPGVSVNRTIAALAANVDLAPTFAELGGVSLPVPPDGRSLISVLGGESPAAWRNAILLERPDLPARDPRAAETWGEEALEVEPGEGSHPGFRGIRLQDEVFVEHSQGACEDYDLIRDPAEVANRCAALPPARRARLSAWLAALATCRGPGCRDLEGQLPP